MIHIHTGLPGHGKTLYTLYYVRRWALKEKRDVYYHGIPELDIPGWQELEDPKKWHELPPKSIVIIDEAQKTFPVRGSGAAVPPHVAAAETHRHKGIDAVFITQHPLLIDGHIRRLSDKHRHIIRAFGAQRATVHEWPQVMEQCQKPGARKESVKEGFTYPQEIYRWYKSAEAHTFKAKIPGKVIFAVLLPFIIIGLVALAVHFLWTDFGGGGVEAKKAEAEQSALSGQSGSVSSSTGQGSTNRTKTREEWLAEQTPRVPDLPHTAPAYDGVTQAAVAPYPAACISTAKRCQCYTQQGTRMVMRDQLCRQIAEVGFFVAWNSEDPTQRKPEHGPAQPGGAPALPRLPEPVEVRGGRIGDAGSYAGVPAIADAR